MGILGVAPVQGQCVKVFYLECFYAQLSFSFPLVIHEFKCEYYSPVNQGIEKIIEILENTHMHILKKNQPLFCYKHKRKELLCSYAKKSGCLITKINNPRQALTCVDKISNPAATLATGPCL